MRKLWCGAIGLGLSLSISLGAPSVHAQGAAVTFSEPYSAAATAAPQAGTDAEAPAAPMSIDPYEAYTQGRFADAFEGFANLQVKRPKDVDLMLNIGASLYRLKDYAGAEKAWALAAEHGDPNMRAHALYNMGNSAFQQKNLKEAVKHFEGALSLDPNDVDTQHNLRLAQKRLAQQEAQPKNQDPNAPQDPNQKSDSQTSQDPNQTPQQDPNQQASPQDANAPHDGDAPEDKQASHNKQAPKADDKTGAKAADEASEAGDKNDDDESKASPEQDKEQDAQGPKRMPRSQAERILDGMGESRPRHAPPAEGATRRPPDGMDW